MGIAYLPEDGKDHDTEHYYSESVLYLRNREFNVAVHWMKWYRGNGGDMTRLRPTLEKVLPGITAHVISMADKGDLVEAMIVADMISAAGLEIPDLTHAVLRNRKAIETKLIRMVKRNQFSMAHDYACLLYTSPSPRD